MKFFVGILIAILVTCDPVLCQIEHGTIAVIYYTPERVIIAADSRGRLVGADGAGHEDDECKVAGLGDKIAFVAAGFSGYDSKGTADKLPTWRASGEAHKAYSEAIAQLKDHANESALSLTAARWGELMRRHVTEVYAFQPKTLRDSAVNGLLTSGLFAGTDVHGHLLVLLVQLRLGQGAEVVPPKEINTATCPPCALGDGAIFLEFFNKTTERARDEAARWDIRKRHLPKAEFDRLWTIRFVDLTILLYPNPDEVGGFIDALEVGRRGVTWIQRKNKCPAE